MLNLIKSINIEVARYMSVAIVLLIIICHSLVILQVIPYTWINGGRSVSYELQKKQSMSGIIVLLMTIPFLLIASNIITIPIGGIGASIINIMLWTLVILLIISFVMQLLGTAFERYVMSILVFILLVCVLRIAI